MQAATNFFDGLTRRLDDNGYRTKRDVILDKYNANVVGIKRSFELRLTNFLTRYIIVTEIDQVDVLTAKDYAESSLRYALGNNPLATAIRPISGGILAVGVIVSQDFTDEVKDWVRKEPLSRRLAFVGCPVLLSLTKHEPYSPNQPSILGRAFFAEVKKILGILTDF
jgi:hypothetical protein